MPVKHHRAPVAGGDRLAGRAACTYSLQERSAGGSPAGRPVRHSPPHYRRDVDQRAAADADAAGRAPAVAGPQVASQAMIARIASVADARISCSSTRLRVRRRIRARDTLSKSVIGEAEVGVPVGGGNRYCLPGCRRNGSDNCHRARLRVPEGLTVLLHVQPQVVEGVGYASVDHFRYLSWCCGNASRRRQGHIPITIPYRIPKWDEAVSGSLILGSYSVQPPPVIGLLQVATGP
jgi:hypothetical protein